jgi:mannosyl-oligosaccharide alpha-1,2-mannosidase
MRVSLALIALGAVSQGALAAPTSESTTIPEFVPNRERADAVREAFRFAWKGYYKYAFPHDELHPRTNGYGDSR